MEKFQNVINDQVLTFETNLASIIRAFSSKLNASFKFTTVKDVIVPIEENFEQVAIIAGELAESLTNAGYYDLVKEFTSNNDDFTVQQIKDMSKRFKKAKTYYGAIEPTTLSSLKSMQYNGMADLGVTRLNTIKSALFQSVLAGTSRETLIANMEKQMQILEREATTYLRTAKREYSQQVENQIAKEAGLTEIIWEYVGAPLQDNSHPECRCALEEKEHAPYFTQEEKDEFEAGGGECAHDEPRWNCQHIFGITDLTYEEYLKR